MVSVANVNYCCCLYWESFILPVVIIYTGLRNWSVRRFRTEKRLQSRQKHRSTTVRHYYGRRTHKHRSTCRSFQQTNNGFVCRAAAVSWRAVKLRLLVPRRHAVFCYCRCWRRSVSNSVFAGFDGSQQRRVRYALITYECQLHFVFHSLLPLSPATAANSRDYYVQWLPTSMPLHRFCEILLICIKGWLIKTAPPHCYVYNTKIQTRIG